MSSAALRSVGPLALACTALACGPDQGIDRVSDAGFVYPAQDTAAEDATTSDDATTSGCAVMDLDGCTAGRLCCAVPTERCVPSATGASRCLESGELAEGEVCGSTGTDDCGFGLLCASAARGPERLVCRVICTDGEADCDGDSCSVALEIGGESIGLCD